MKLNETNILTPETPAKTMVSDEVLRVEHAPCMNFLESVRHFAFLLSEKTLRYVSGNKRKETGAIAHKVECFAPELKRSDRNNIGNASGTANAAMAMFNECRDLNNMNKKRLSNLDPIGDYERKIVITKAKQSPQ